MEKPAQAAKLDISNGLPVAADIRYPDLREHHEGLNSPTATGTKMLPSSGTTKAFTHSMEDKLDQSASANPVEVNHMSVHVSTDEMNSKEHKTCYQKSIAVNPKDGMTYQNSPILEL